MTGKEEKDILHVHVGRERTKTSKGACGQQCYICDCLTFISWGESTLILMLSKYWTFLIASLFYFIWLGSWQNVTGIYKSKLFFTRRRHLLYFEKYFSEKKKKCMFEVMRTILKVCSLANIFIGKNKIIPKQCNTFCFN